MPSAQSYANYTAIELAMDPVFIAWVKNPDRSSNLFWEQFLAVYPLQSPVVNKARKIVSEMKMTTDAMDEQRAAEVWNRINEKIMHAATGKRMPRVISMRKWWVAASVLLMVAAGGYFFWKKEEPSLVKSVSNNPNSQHDVAPGTNKAVLTLADGSRISLDSTNNGSIRKVGNVTIIQMDGKVSYKQQEKENSTKREIIYNTITTPKGGQYQLVLADGSNVWLNAASSLRFPTSFTGNERTVRLTGEAYFEVAHNDAVPFIVEKGDAKVQVLGTHFNIDAYDDEQDIKVTLLEGSVRVSKGVTEKLLKPGQQAQIAGDINMLDHVNIEKVMAWKNGWFEFDDADLATIMRQISRWYDVDIEYETKPGNQLFGGRISKNLPMSELLKMLENSGVKGFRLEGKKLFVQP